MEVTVITASFILIMFVLCFALVGANTDRHEDDLLQEKYLKEWKEKHDDK